MREKSQPMQRWPMTAPDGMKIAFCKSEARVKKRRFGKSSSMEEPLLGKQESHMPQ
jgi:hypothetical protein